jgi:hypothetical protein
LFRGAGGSYLHKQAAERSAEEDHGGGIHPLIFSERANALKIDYGISVVVTLDLPAVKLLTDHGASQKISDRKSFSYATWERHCAGNRQSSSLAERAIHSGVNAVGDRNQPRQTNQACGHVAAVKTMRPR